MYIINNYVFRVIVKYGILKKMVKSRDYNYLRFFIFNIKRTRSSRHSAA